MNIDQKRDRNAPQGARRIIRRNRKRFRWSLNQINFLNWSPCHADANAHPETKQIRDQKNTRSRTH